MSLWFDYNGGSPADRQDYVATHDDSDPFVANWVRRAGYYHEGPGFAEQLQYQNANDIVQGNG